METFAEHNNVINKDSVVLVLLLCELPLFVLCELTTDMFPTDNTDLLTNGIFI